MRRCRALFIAAPSSGEGKTTVTAALARLCRRAGLRVQVFKTGPDYLDPQVLAQASGQPVKALDLWMAGLPRCQQWLHDAAAANDVILVEGAMGLYDGEPSSADLAQAFGLPLLLLLNVKGMAQTAAAIALGLARYRPALNICGVLANHCSTERHRELIAAALPADLPLRGVMPRDERAALPERHLGLVQASEVTAELEQRFEAGASLLEQGLRACQPPISVTDGLTLLHEGLPEGLLEGLLEWLPEIEFNAPDAADLPALPPPLLRDRTVAIARDAAFSFIYQNNLDTLRALGAELVFFSPLTDSCLPPADALWLPGGYPELHAAALSRNTELLTDIRAFHASGRAILAECGGLLYCLDTLTDLEGETHSLGGVLPGAGAMRGKRGCQGMQTALLPEGRVRAHAHHRSRADIPLEPIGYGERQRHPAPGEPIFRHRGLTATYLHLYFADNPVAIAELLRLGTANVAREC